MPTFEPPTVDDVPQIYLVWPDPHYPADRLGQRLRRFYGPNPRGRSVLKIDGVYQTIDTPTTTQIASATEVYMGGHIYDIDQTTADALTAAGYTLAQLGGYAAGYSEGY